MAEHTDQRSVVDQQAKDVITDALDATAYFTHEEARVLAASILAALKERGWRHVT